MPTDFVMFADVKSHGKEFFQVMGKAREIGKNWSGNTTESMGIDKIEKPIDPTEKPLCLKKR